MADDDVVRSRAYVPVKVEIDGALFESVDPTEADNDKVSAIYRDLESVAEEASRREESEELTREQREELVGEIEKKERELRFAVFDILLRPIAGGQKKPATVLRAGLKSGAVTPRDFNYLWDEVPAAIGRANGAPEGEDGSRPT